MKLAGFADEAAADIMGQIAALKALGWKTIELRSVDGISAHDLEEDKLASVYAALEQEEIEVCALGSTIANWGQSVQTPFDKTKHAVERAIACMKKLRIPYIRIMSYAVELDEDGRALSDQQEQERFKRLRYICDRFLDNELIPVHENCHTYGGMSFEHTLRLLNEVPGLKLVYDTGNPPVTPDFRNPFPYSRQDSWKFYEHVKEHIVHVHIKDAGWDDVSGDEIYRYPGEGNGAVLPIVTDLLRNGYDGTFSIEPHMTVVFHDASVQASDTIRFENFVSYGRKFESLLEEATKQVKLS